ncbi:hypothetical protein [Pseudalkalibacillus hwajinpoensis]|uniref:hypothetical protein n=1 Tax=Guptibacillus hwajinpoensis TaxID=208199 RepID=UPI001CD28010|nr:hypothetical protein [Pseudalkalibacillus hwajinpoensis]MCA0990006.1 hypothetical protein [Pseudalkalibacillus hwajinpoensis]
MSSLFDDCNKEKNRSKCDKCLCHQLHKRNEGSKFFILVDGFPEFIEATLVYSDSQKCCATFVVNDMVSPMNVFPSGMGSTFTLIVDCRDLRALISVHN